MAVCQKGTMPIMRKNSRNTNPKTAQALASGGGETLRKSRLAGQIKGKVKEKETYLHDGVVADSFAGKLCKIRRLAYVSSVIAIINCQYFKFLTLNDLVASGGTPDKGLKCTDLINICFSMSMAWKTDS